MAQIILDHGGSGCFGTRLAPNRIIHFFAVLQILNERFSAGRSHPESARKSCGEVEGDLTEWNWRSRHV